MDPNEADRGPGEPAATAPFAVRQGRAAAFAAPVRRMVGYAVAGALGVGILWLALSALPRPRHAEPAEEIDRSIYLLPLRTQPAGPDEETTPFTGFAVSIDSDPPGAVVSIAGAVRGEAPVLANVGCRGSEKVEIRAEKKGFRPVRRELSCRADTLVKVTLHLER